MLGLPKAVTGSLQRYFPDVVLGAELTPCKSRVAPGTCMAPYQPSLSIHRSLPLFLALSLAEQTHFPTSLRSPLHLPTHSHQVFPCPSSPGTTLQLAVARTASLKPQRAFPVPHPELPGASIPLCLLRAASTAQQQSSPAESPAE